MKKERKCGILLPVTSLPSKYGIGCFSKEAYEFIDFLADAGQSYWQVLPLGVTGYGDSPYQAFSTFAGNPYMVDLEELIEEGWLTEKECEKAEQGKDPEKIDYEKIYRSRLALLKKAFLRSDVSRRKEYRAFVRENAFWLEDFSFFMAMKLVNRGKSFIRWEDGLRLHKANAIAKYKKDPKLKSEMDCCKFVQYYFFRQWDRLKKYANEKGVRIIGDLPIYVAFDSADTWSHPELFQLDEKGYPIAVAGCPPDYFSQTGQLWGNPLYRWEDHRKSGYEWWMQRLEFAFRLFDVVRIDHFRGFDEYYSIPYGNPTAEFGHWEKGPGYDLFRTMKEKLGEKEIIAEDLGFLTPGVRKLVKKTGYPGMKILEFAFDSAEDNDYLPHNYDRNCVVYTGTHDNDTVLGWFSTLAKRDQQFTKDYLGIKNTKHIGWELIRLALASVSDTAVIPLQDYLELGSEARINTPSTLGNNWDWRMKKGSLTPPLAERIRKTCAMYGRCEKE
ncbi:MAG: 4-alpha-glucanotransferase [Lachnospiraceae bacterium]|nr:4-alpha-glucanotransferase [Lachnospiraceae bacterium]